MRLLSKLDLVISPWKNFPLLRIPSCGKTRHLPTKIVSLWWCSVGGNSAHFLLELSNGGLTMRLTVSRQGRHVPIPNKHPLVLLLQCQMDHVSVRRSHLSLEGRICKDWWWMFFVALAIACTEDIALVVFGPVCVWMGHLFNSPESIGVHL